MGSPIARGSSAGALSRSSTMIWAARAAASHDIRRRLEFNARMIANNVIPIPQRCVDELSLSEQFEGCDFKLYGKHQRLIEVKTEREKSENLYVQCGERNHNPNLVVGADGEVVEHVTPLA
jgi:hypothetical protein